jgi:hypothetical protein
VQSPLPSHYGAGSRTRPRSSPSTPMQVCWPCADLCKLACAQHVHGMIRVSLTTHHTEPQTYKHCRRGKCMCLVAPTSLSQMAASCGSLRPAMLPKLDALPAADLLFGEDGTQSLNEAGDAGLEVTSSPFHDFNTGKVSQRGVLPFVGPASRCCCLECVAGGCVLRDDLTPASRFTSAQRSPGRPAFP